MIRPREDEFEQRVRDFLHARTRSGSRGGVATCNLVLRRIRGRSPAEFVERERLGTVRRLSAGAAFVLLVLSSMAWHQLTQDAATITTASLWDEDDVLPYVTSSDTTYGNLAGDQDLLIAMLWGDSR